MTTRNTLLQDLNSWVGRDDLAADPAAGSILRITESVINRSVRLREQEKTAVLTCEGRTTPLPDDFISFRSVTIDSSTDRQIEQLSPEQIRKSGVWLNQQFRGENTPAAAYSLEGANLILAPEPTAESPVKLDIVYFAKLPALIGDSDTNLLLTNHYDVYLWAALQAAAIFLEDGELEAAYSNRLAVTLEELTKNERRARFSGSGLRPTGNVRMIT